MCVKCKCYDAVLLTNEAGVDLYQWLSLANETYIVFVLDVFFLYKNGADSWCPSMRMTWDVRLKQRLGTFVPVTQQTAINTYITCVAAAISRMALQLRA